MRRQLGGHLAMLAFSAIVAGSFVLGALIANDISPVALTVVRFWLAGFILLGAARAVHGRCGVGWAGWWRFPLLAVFMAIYFVLMFEGLKTAPAVSSSAVFTLTPIMAAGFGWLLLRQRLTPRMALALLIGGAGALWVIFRGDPAALLRFEIGRGEMIFFWGCMGHAFYTPLVATLKRGEPLLAFAGWTLIAGAALLTLWGWRDLLATDWLALPGLVWVTVIYVAVFASAGTFSLLQLAALRLPSAKVMAYTYLTPSWVILWQLAFGGTGPGASVMVGVGLTAFALLLLLRDDGTGQRDAAGGTNTVHSR